MVMAAPRAPVGGWVPRPPQKVGHGFQFVEQLLSRKQVSQKGQVEPNLSPLRGVSNNFFVDAQFFSHFFRNN